MELVFINAQSTSMNIKNSADLKAAIQELKSRQQLEKEQLAESFYGFKESLKPINLLKSTFNSVKETPGLGGLLVNTTLGMGAGLLSKKLMVGKSAGLLKKLFGSAVELGVAGLVANNSGTLKSAANQLLKNIFRSKKKDEVTKSD